MSDIPVKFIAYDLLEVNGVDIRLKSFEERRLLLEKSMNHVSEKY